MIRVVTLARLDPADLTALIKALYKAFGVGTEHAGDRDPPQIAAAKGKVDAVAYVVINVALVAAWALTGFGDFWPGWVLGIWGVFLLLDAWNVYYRRPITDEEIDESLDVFDTAVDEVLGVPAAVAATVR